MSKIAALLPKLDKLRSIAGKLGLHPFTVLVRVTHWSGGRPGLGTKTTTDTPLRVAGNQNPKVKQVTGQDALLSGGLYTNQDFKVGPFTPSFPGGGLADTTIDPVVQQGDEVLFFINGPGLAPNGAWFKRIGDKSDSSMHIYLILRSVGVVNP